jgi:hypothetical protein
MATSTEAEVKAAINTILSDTKAYTTSLNWAVNYCKAALAMSGYDLSVQILYILNNISHWRHPEAKNIRMVLKNFKA